LRIQTKPWLIFLLIALVTLLSFYGLDRYQHRFVRSDRDLLHLLPGGDATFFYAQVDALRRAGLLNVVAGSKKAEDPEYQTFVRATGFDYSRDVDAIAGSARQEDVLLAAKGRFDWSRIRAYVRAHGGQCAGDRCQLPANKPGNWVDLVRIQPNVMGVGLGKQNTLAGLIHPGQDGIDEYISSDPVWVKLAPRLLKNPAELPVALRIFAISMESAETVVIALAPPHRDSSDAFEIKLSAQCPVAATAETVRSQLEIDTKMLKLELAHEHEQPNPADLTGLMTSGRFSTNGKEVGGEWPVSKELVKALQ
jgi:hypothetical protein